MPAHPPSRCSRTATTRTPDVRRSPHLFVCRPELRALHRHRRLVQGRFHRGVLRRRRRCPSRRQWHGHRRGLDECRLLHLHGRNHRLHGLRRRRLSNGLDGGLCAAGASVCALFAQVRRVHGAGLHRCPLLLQRRQGGGGALPDRGVLHLRRRANARRRHRLQPLSERTHHLGGGHRHGGGVPLRRARRHEGHHLHPSRPILRVDLRLPDAGDLHLPDDDRHARPTAWPRLGTGRRQRAKGAGEAGSHLGGSSASPPTPTAARPRSTSSPSRWR